MNDRTWAEAWALLEDRFEVQKSSPLRTFYRDRIEARLTEEEFRDAVGVILDAYPWRREQPYAFPRPVDFVLALREENTSAQALDDWITVRQAIGSRDFRASEELPEAAVKALGSLGGIAALGRAEPGELQHYRREFLRAREAYTESGPLHESRKALPKGEET